MPAPFTLAVLPRLSRQSSLALTKNPKSCPLKAGKKEIKVKVGSKTEMAGFECPTKLTAGASLEIHGCNCATKKGKLQEATKVAVAGKKKGKKKDA